MHGLIVSATRQQLIGNMPGLMRVEKPLDRLSCAERIVAFYNHRGTCEQYIKEGKGAVKWMRLSCRSFAANAVRLQLHALAYNLGIFMRNPGDAQDRGTVVADQPTGEADQDRRQGVSHGRYVTFQMAEVAVPQQMFKDILRLIAQLRAPPAPA
jgi:hypothetical protein